MEQVVMGILGLVTDSLTWGLDNAFALVVGAVLGGPLSRAVLGVVGDVLGRTKDALDSVSHVISGK